jgi:cytochrome P450 family 135
VYSSVPLKSSPPTVAPPRRNLRAIDRWIAPQRFRNWTDTTPDRYLLGLPLAPELLLTSDPEDARAIFTERDGALQFGEGLRRLAPHEPMFGHDALDVLDGPQHTRVRRQLTAAFHGEALRGYERRIVAVTEQHLAAWPLGEPVALAGLMRTLARDVIAAVVFGVTEPARAARLHAALDDLERAVNSIEMTARFALATMLRGRWAPFPRIEGMHREIAAITREEIAARRKTDAGDDCLARFLALDPDGQDAFTDQEIVDAMRVLVIAGWATTANTLAWLGERLARHPAALARCHEDVAGSDGAGARYLTACVQETLRMRPAVPFTLRYVAGDFDLRGLTVRQGTLLAVDIERLHYRRDVYPDPHSFRPERFLDERPGTYTWVPFGGGVHRCIGAGFALTESRLILQTMLRRLTFAPEHGPGERSRRTVMITAPAGGATVTLRGV